MRVFKTRWFVRYAKKSSLSDSMLCEAVTRAERGVIDADLGGDVIKQRVARPGQGRSGGYRFLIAFRTKTRAVFVYGFAKNERDNIAADELATLRELAKAFLSASDKQIEAELEAGRLTEVDYEN